VTLGAVLALAAGTYALRLTGPLMRGRLRMSARWERMMSIAAVTLLGAFVASSALLESGGFAGWARVAGVAAGAVAALRGAPFVLVVLVAAGTTAGLRFLV
jgi:branched-subunit amino acid transport protein